MKDRDMFLVYSKNIGYGIYLFFSWKACFRGNNTRIIIMTCNVQKTRKWGKFNVPQDWKHVHRVWRPYSLWAWDFEGWPAMIWWLVLLSFWLAPATKWWYKLFSPLTCLWRLAWWLRFLREGKEIKMKTWHSKQSRSKHSSRWV